MRPDQNATSEAPAWRPSKAASVVTGRCAAIALGASFPALPDAGAPDGTGATRSVTSAESAAWANPADQSGTAAAALSLQACGMFAEVPAIPMIASKSDRVST